jgi:hypothetical protein
MIQLSLIASFMHEESFLIINHVRDKGHPLSKCNPQWPRIRQGCKKKKMWIFNKDFFQTFTLKMFLENFIKSYVHDTKGKICIQFMFNMIQGKFDKFFI